MARVIIVGGGLAGLVLAYQLKWRSSEFPSGLEIQVLESSGRVGGRISTTWMGPWCIEGGPEGFDGESPWTLALIERLGLVHQLVDARPEAGRGLVWKGDTLHPVPTTPGEAVKGGLVPRRAWLRALVEPLAAPPPGIDETLGGFFRRRLGTQVGDIVADVLAGEMYLGDADILSLESAFPRIAALERDWGGLTRAVLGLSAEMKARQNLGRQQGFNIADEVVGLLASNSAEAGMRKRSGGESPTGHHGLTSFTRGMETLIEGLRANLGNRILTSHRVVKVSGHAPGRLSGPYQVQVQTRRGLEVFEADSVVLALPSGSGAKLMGDFDAGLASALEAIPAVDVATISLSIPRALVAHPLDARGYVVLRGESLTHRQVVFTSSLFEGRAAPGHVALKVMVGGIHHPELLKESDPDLVRRVVKELRQTVGLSGEPTQTHVARLPGWLPQYVAGHREKLATLQRRLTLHPGLEVTGGSYRGFGVADIVRDTDAVADRVVNALRHREGRGSSAA